MMNNIKSGEAMANDGWRNSVLDLCLSKNLSQSPVVQNLFKDMNMGVHSIGLQNLTKANKIQQQSLPPNIQYNVYNVVCSKDHKHKLRKEAARLISYHNQINISVLENSIYNLGLDFLVDSSGSISRIKRSQMASANSLSPEEKLELRQIINRLNMCHTIDVNCNGTIKRLGVEENDLLERIQKLEMRHHDGLNKLRTMEGAWASFETAYKEKLQLSKEKQIVLSKQGKFVGDSIEKYRNILKIKEIVLNDLNEKGKNIRKSIKDAETKISSITEDMKQYKQKENVLKQKKIYTEDAITKTFIEFDNQQNIHRSRMKSLDKQVIEAMENKEKKMHELGEELNIRRGELMSVKRQLQEELLRIDEIKRERSIKEIEKHKRNINEMLHNGIHSRELFENGYAYACTDMYKTENRFNNLSKNIDDKDSDFINESQKESFECDCNHDEKQFEDSELNVKDCPSDDDISFERYDSVRQNLLSGIFESIKSVMKGALHFQNPTSDDNSYPVMIKVKNGEVGKIDKSTKSALQNMLMDQLHINLEDFVTNGAAKAKLKQATEKLAKNGISEKLNCSLSLKLSLDSISKETASIGAQYEGEFRKQPTVDVYISTTDLQDPNPLDTPMNSPISKRSSTLQFHSTEGSSDRHADYLLDANKVTSRDKSILWASLRLNEFTPRLKVSPLQSRNSKSWQRPPPLIKRLSPMRHRFSRLSPIPTASSPTRYRSSPSRLKVPPLRHLSSSIDRKSSPLTQWCRTSRQQSFQQGQQQLFCNNTLANGEPKSNRFRKYSELTSSSQKRSRRNINPFKTPIMILASARTIKRNDAGKLPELTRTDGSGRPTKGRRSANLKDPNTDRKVNYSMRKR